MEAGILGLREGGCSSVGQVLTLIPDSTSLAQAARINACDIAGADLSSPMVQGRC